MATINTYLLFNGNCEEAFNFYKSAFGGEFTFMEHFKDMPPQEGMPPLSEEMAKRIMHVSLPISKETILMGSDAGGEWVSKFRAGNNFSVSVTADTREEADKLFKGLSEGGTVTMPMQNTFWGSYYGMFIDKFGVSWMISFSENQPA